MSDTDSVVVAVPDSLPGDSTARDTLDRAAPDSAAQVDSAAVADSATEVDPAAVGDAGAVGERGAVGDSAVSDTLDAGPTDPPYPQPDDIFGLLLEEAGYQAIQYRGRTVELDVGDEVVRLAREAQATYEQATIDADTITYRAGLQFVRACGGIAMTGQGQDAVSDECLNYDVSGTRGTILDARTAFSERGAEWFIRGHTTMRGSGTAFVETGNFTSCENEEPHYYFRAGQIKVVSNDIIVAWPVTLYIQNVPVAWLPFFAQDIREERRSGFLPPRFGFNDVVASSSNTRRSVTDFGYYFAFNDFMDAQATADWFSGRFTRLNGAFRYRSIKKFFRGNLMTSYSFGNEKTLQFQMRHNHELTPVTDIRVNANFVSNTTVFERQTFDPTLQTQRIASDVGIQHRFPFASVNLSGSRRQDLGAQKGRTDLTLPKLQMSFSPLTLFRAPQNRSGPFNNIVINGGLSASRLDRTRDEDDGKRTERAGANAAIRIGSFGVTGHSSFDRQTELPFQPADVGGGGDSTEVAAAPPGVAKLSYRAQADYQVDLIGSTTFRPTVSVDASQFQSEDTNGEFVTAPMRLRIGAALGTDLYAFLPGFGPFERIRHKVSPRFQFDYSPAIEASDSLLSIPGFPVSNSKVENRLNITLNQTFEAKLGEEVELDAEAAALLEGRSLEDDSLAAAADSVTSSADSLAAAADSGMVVADEGAAAPPEADAPATDARGVLEAGPGARGADTGDPSAPRRAQPRRNVVMLGINSSPLLFDFSRENEPALTTDRWSHRINSDLLRGLSLNMSLDLFEGTGEDRTFAPILSSLTGSFTFSSASGLGGLLGLGGGGGGSGGSSDPASRLRNASNSRFRLQSFDENPDPQDPGMRTGSPWTLSLTYSMQRGREDESARDRQSLNAVLSLNPTPNWRLAWRTSYNLTDREFGEHLITLDRALHRWMATFMFARSPNGNFIFQMSVNLRDAPDLKFDYDQQTQDR